MKKKINVSDEFINKIWVYFETNLTTRTRKEYWNVVNLFTNCVGHDPYELTLQDANKFYRYLLDRINNQTLSYTTGVMRYSVMRSICDFIKNYKTSHGENYTNYFRDFTIPEQDKTINEADLPTLKEIDKVLNKALECNDYRAFTIFSLCLKLGLTNTEVCHLQYENIAVVDDSHLAITLPPAKRITRILGLDKDISKILDKYIKEYQVSSGALFYNNRKNPIKMRDTERLLLKYIDLINEEEDNSVRPFTMQSLRHVAFIMMLKGGASNNSVAKFGGITTKWMGRYERLVGKESVDMTGALSILSIKNKAQD